MVKKVIICITVFVAVIFAIFFMFRDQTIVADNGVIVDINASQKTLKIDIGEREYLIPDIFVCDTYTKYYKSSDTRKGKESIRFNDLVVNQNIIVKYDFLTSKVYEIIVKNSN